MNRADGRPVLVRAPSAPSRRQFLAAVGAAGPVTAASAAGAAAAPLSVSFPHSYLYCAPRKTDIWVRMQMECYGEIIESSGGRRREFALGTVAKTGLTPIAATDSLAPGYDYSVVFSRSHVYTKRSHASAAFNNPSTQRIEDFGEASWVLHRIVAEPLKDAATIRAALQSGRQLTAETEFASDDGAYVYRVIYPVKWADCKSDGSAFRVETGPVVLLDPRRTNLDDSPAFDDFQWAHLDYADFSSVRCLVESPTPILEDVAFSPARKRIGMTEAQVKAIRRALESPELAASETGNVFTTDHYSRAEVRTVTHRLFALGENAPAYY